ncbi:RNA polymerase sigma factor, RpoD/SigA family [Komarekiella sp. 'clone 1']|uniref:RNA polymerase sigma factor, RpoD/SigA family n=1 Tax=Komarekiella delphini-convector SJRDD-AB1 TaxID=2593771 RepID=A0AA40T470_9NOST|nr:RNA polymerase sigma factor, RpoD/SigA family [Komarekiella delphini-convector]MBD6620614.1 RNA polymerase sigma factor, RpoD/SigA family [Komarekiella delphini-convector SJRDD-AB1]
MTTATSDLVHSYLKQIGRYPLLSPSQEIAYAREVQQMIAIEQATEQQAQQLNRQPTNSELAATLGKTEAEITQILNQGQRAKQKMVIANLRLVVSIAKKYQNRNLEFPDLIQEGALGLQRSIEKFDPNRGYKLSTYAYWWITQAITRAIAEKSRVIRLPIHLNERLNKIKNQERELSQSLGRRPTVTEIAESLKLKPSLIRESLNVSKNPVSLEMRVGAERETELINILPIPENSPSDQINQEFLYQDLSKLLALLNPKQREVLTLRFGLGDERPMSVNQIAKRLKLSRERVVKIEHQAMTILRRHRDNIKEHLIN